MPALHPFQSLRPTKIVLRRLRCQEHLRFTMFWRAFSGASKAPPPPLQTPPPPLFSTPPLRPPSTTSPPHPLGLTDPKRATRALQAGPGLAKGCPPPHTPYPYPMESSDLTTGRPLPVAPTANSCAALRPFDRSAVAIRPVTGHAQPSDVVPPPALLPQRPPKPPVCSTRRVGEGSRTAATPCPPGHAWPMARAGALLRVDPPQSSGTGAVRRGSVGAAQRCNGRRCRQGRGALPPAERTGPGQGQGYVARGQ